MPTSWPNSGPNQRAGHERNGVGRTMMVTRIVMDHTGDTRHCFNPDDVRVPEKTKKPPPLGRSHPVSGDGRRLYRRSGVSRWLLKIGCCWSLGTCTTTKLRPNER